MFCIYIRTNSVLCHLQHKLIGFYNRDEKCLQRGTDWVCKYSGLRFAFKGLNNKKYLVAIDDLFIIQMLLSQRNVQTKVHLILAQNSLQIFQFPRNIRRDLCCLCKHNVVQQGSVHRCSALTIVTAVP